jgi:polyhydroxyalkanoate synthesis regulator phasin
MSEIILPSLITGGLALIGVIITNLFTSSNNSKKLTQENAKIINGIQKENAKVINDIKLEITSYHASTDEKIKELTREVREHNNFAQRMPAVEEKIDNLKEKVNYFHNV